MRQLLLYIYCLCFALSSSAAQSNVIINDSTMFIGSEVDSLTEEQRYFNPIYLVVQQGKEHLKQLLIRGSICDCDTTLPNRRIGVFAIAPDKHVTFSQGNLQHFPAANLWKFADNQYEYLGNANKYLSPTFRNWTDLFAWNTSEQGDFLDWGANEICGDAAHTWRTLTKDEWDYLMYNRPGANMLRTKGSINGRRGIILLPDNYWQTQRNPNLTFIADNDNLPSGVNAFTEDEWRILEDAGVVFLPAAGTRRLDATVAHTNIFGGYWSSTSKNTASSFLQCFHVAPCSYSNYSNLGYGRSVRLVHDTIIPPIDAITIPDLVIPVNDTLSINLIQVQRGTFMMGATGTDNKAEQPQHPVTITYDYYVMQTEVTQELWKAIMGTTTNSIASQHTPVGNVSWNDCQVFIKQLNKQTGFYFRLPTEAEWEYAARGGQHSHGYTYAGSNTIDSVAWYGRNSNSQLHNVGTKLPNELGIYDMSGNAWEWCADYYGAYTAEAQTNPQGPQTGTGRVLRGGSFNTVAATRCTATYRQSRTEDYPDTHISFRLVLDLTPSPGKIIIINDSVSINMMTVEGGTFTMGKGKDAHPVTLSDFYIAQTELTQAQWEAVMNEKATDYKQNEIFGDNYPMASISLADCQRFVDTLNQRTGLHFRIPTEAEWEYAAKGGKYSRGYTFSGSNNIDDVTLLKGNNRTDENGNDIYHPEPVMSCKPNELGIYDMTGNLTEWVSDWWVPFNTYPQINPTGAATCPTGKYKLTHRGGCWTTPKEACTTSSRTGFVNRGANGVGFRLALSDKEPFRAVYINDTTRFYLRPIEKGTFMMGSKEDDPIVNQNLAAKGDELPQHQVTLDSDYYMAEYEVTQELWEAVMGTDVYDLHAALSKKDGYPTCVGPSYPLYYAYTSDMLEFTRRLSAMTGIHFRLPTEAEWEFAARGGNLSHGYLYAGSNNVDSVAWHSGSGLQLVGQKMPNELGLYDMSGNVLERCIDYLEYGQPYEPGAVTNPRGYIKQSGNRAYRGGAHGMHKDSVRVTHRAPQTPTFTSQNVGARLVVNEEHHFQTFNVGSVWFDMIFVKGGSVATGDTLPNYYIGQTEVTQALWKAVMGNNPSKSQGNNLPVESVSWEDCQKFVQKLNKLTGLNFRLPTEAEWEYAAKGGHKSQGYTYAGSNDINEVAWYRDNANDRTHEFAKKLPNELGIYDMTGNVWEWCLDSKNTGHLLCGGAYDSKESACTIHSQAYRPATHISHFSGFRLLLEDE